MTSFGKAFPASWMGLTAVLAAWGLGLDVAGAAATVVACAAIAILGLPHGSLDLRLIRLEMGSGAGPLRLVTLYLGCAAAMLVLWQVHALLALVLFLTIAVAHFAEDWEDTGSPFLSVGLAAAILSVPALFYRSELTTIFDAMIGARSTMVADGLLLIAPLSTAVAVVAVIALIGNGRADLGVEALGALAAMIMLPPAIGFAIFFCLVHSPRHFRAGIGRLNLSSVWKWMPVVVPVTSLAYAIGVGVFLLDGSAPGVTALVSTIFILLSLLVVPHMAMPWLVGVGRAPAIRNVAGMPA